MRLLTPEIITVPSEMNDAWLADFNALYEGSGYVATVQVDDWLEPPTTADVGSGYYTLGEEMGRNGWLQKISGGILSATETNLPRCSTSTTGIAPVLALAGASLELPEGGRQMLDKDTGKPVLIRLDRLFEATIEIEEPAWRQYLAI